MRCSSAEHVNVGWIRIILKTFALTVVCSLTFIVAACGGAHWKARVFRLSTRTVSRILGMRVVVTGEPPAAPFVLVSNHLSYVDVILIGSQVRCVFVSKAEVEDWPLIGPLVRSVGTLFVDRGAKRDLPHVVKSMEHVLESGRGVVFFPEGTTSGGEGVAPFRPSLLEPAVRSGRPVHYASLSYRTQSICWWGDMKFTPHALQLLAMPGFEARLTFGKEPIREDDRKVLATRLRQAIEQQFEAVG